MIAEKGKRKKEIGSSTVENIVWLPMLLIVLAAIIQFGLYFNGRIAVQAAAYEAARQAAVADNPEDIAEKIVYGFGGGTLPGWNSKRLVSVSVETYANPKPGDPVKVDVEYRVPLFMSGLMPTSKSSDGFMKVKGTSSTTIEERP